MSHKSRFQLSEIEQHVCEISANFLGFPRGEVELSSRFIEDLHCDSLEILELFMTLEDTFSVSIPSPDANSVCKSVFARPSFCIGDLAEVIYLQQGQGLPVRRGKRHDDFVPAANGSNPFLQLGGRWERHSRRMLDQPLFEPFDLKAEFPVYRRRSDGMRSVLLPAASLEIGSEDPESQTDEQPRHRVELDAFLIDAEPVSTTAYCRFLNSVNCQEHHWGDWLLLAPGDDRKIHAPIRRGAGEWHLVPGVEEFPMILVSWYGANAYALWANNQDWTNYRHDDRFLPSEAQWEYAAQGAYAPPRADIEAVVGMNAGRHVPGESYRADSLPLAGVHHFLGVSDFGLNHMAGNVWHWCRDWYAPDFYQREESTARNPVNCQESGVRSERGGSWVGPADLCRTTHRRGRSPIAKGRCLGFRCVSTPALFS